jgi:hypothetical protein
VHNEDGRASKLLNLTIEEYRKQKALRATMIVAPMMENLTD